jgi:hypothetical protein
VAKINHIWNKQEHNIHLCLSELTYSKRLQSEFSRCLNKITCWCMRSDVKQVNSLVSLVFSQVDCDSAQHLADLKVCGSEIDLE